MTMHKLLVAGQIESFVVLGRPDSWIMFQTAMIDPDRLRARGAVVTDFKTADAAAVHATLTVVRDWQWAWSGDEVPVLMAHLGWTTVESVPDGPIVARATWDLGKLLQMINISHGQVRNVDIRFSGISHWPAVDEDAAPINDSFVEVLAAAESVFGPADESHPGKTPSQVWHLTDCVVRITRTTAGVTADWTERKYFEERRDLDLSALKDWSDFFGRLRRDVADLADEDIVILLYGDRGVQFAQTPRMLLTEAIISPGPLLAQPLPEQEHAELVALGWSPPDVPHFTNWHLELPWPATAAQYDATTSRLVKTLRDVLGVPSPSDLTIKAWSDKTHEPLSLFIVA
ncbi:hypothetical protein ADL00_41225 [Streptomyces sp. AS58]|nr:hypothetical protein ADL00_41225 [Streptomyces sp. AS58]